MGDEPESGGWTRRTFLIELISTAFSLAMLVADVASDLKLASCYLRGGETLNFGLTVSLIVLPSLVVQFYSYAWFASDAKAGAQPWQQMRRHVPLFRWVTADKRLLILVHVLQMGLFLRAVCLIHLGTKACRSHKCKGTWTLLDHWCGLQADLTMLRLFETMLESAPQLLLQVHIVLISRQPSALQCVIIVMSSLSIAWTMADYHMILRESLKDKDKLKLLSRACAVFVLSKYFLLASQLLTLCLLTLLWPWHFVVPVGALIWVLMTLTVCCHGTDFMETRCQEFVYRCTVGFILIFAFFNVKDDSTRWRVILYNGFTVLEIAVVAVEMASQYHGSLLTTQVWMLATLVAIVAAFAIGILLMGFYYVCLHPTRGISRPALAAESAPEAYDEVDAGCCPTAADAACGELQTVGGEGRCGRPARGGGGGGTEIGDSAAPRPSANGRGGDGSRANGTAEGGAPLRRDDAGPSGRAARLERFITL